MFGIFGNKSSYDENRYPWVDYAKGIAIILVAYRHVLGGYAKAGIYVPDYLDMVQQSVYNFRMPLFFILAGIFVRKSLVKRGFKKFTAYKLNTILYPYLVWATLQLTLQIIFSRYSNGDKDLSDYLYLLYYPRALDQFWFLYTIFNITLLFTFFYIYCHIKTIGQLVLGVFFYYLSTLPAVMDISLLQDTLQFYIYFALGSWGAHIILSDRYRPIFASPWLFVGLLPFFLISQWYWVSHQDLRDFAPYLFMLIAILGSMFVFNIAFMLGQARAAHFLRVVGHHSLYIYMMHVIALALARVLLINLLGITHIFILLPLGMVVAVALPIIFYRVSVTNGLWFLYYFKAPRSVRQTAA